MYSSISIKTSPTAEPITVSEAKAWLRVDHDDEDDLISGLITAARMQIEEWTSRALLTQTIVWTMSEATMGTPSPAIDWPVYRALDMPRSPVQAIVSVKQTGGSDGTVTTLTTNDYVADLARDPAALRFNTQPASWLGNVQIEYRAGYGTSGASVPAPLKVALKMLMAHLYEHRGDTPDDIPRAIAILLNPFALNYV